MMVRTMRVTTDCHPNTITPVTRRGNQEIEGRKRVDILAQKNQNVTNGVEKPNRFEQRIRVKRLPVMNLNWTAMNYELHLRETIVPFSHRLSKEN